MQTDEEKGLQRRLRWWFHSDIYGVRIIDTHVEYHHMGGMFYPERNALEDQIAEGIFKATNRFLIEMAVMVIIILVKLIFP